MFEEELYSLFSAAPFFVSFAAGILSFLAPCVLALAPSYISYISGLSLKQIQLSETIGVKEHAKLVATAFLFVLGFSCVFVAIGIFGDLALSGLIVNPWARVIGGAIIVAFGLHFARAINIPFLNMQKRANFTAKAAFLSPFALGVSFALGWTPCAGPVLGAIITMSLEEGARGDAATLMSLFSLGLGLPFLLIAFFASWTLNALDAIKPYFRYVEIAGGVLLGAIGVSYIYDGIRLLTL
ncbi:MAG: cytochrome c biogenesis protein CcdA [Helicobacteraceae bacterium]|jgi:cytochrome c-type biogenesis protein|nr:cytochrome c biogenesis protein CcdA [Helicobacteraceae bacterium]